MLSIETFYKSHKWEDLLKIIKAERLGEDGFLYCEFCGKPIVKAYDCIGHHKIELDEANVNNADISLNPEHIALVHHRCHNIIHNKLGRNIRKVFLVYGSPMAGKTTWVKSVQQPGDLIVDMDNIWECITGLKRYEKPKRLNAVAFGIRDYLLDAVRTRTGFWQQAYVIGGYPLISERERLANRLRAQEILIDTPMEVCKERLHQEQDRDIELWEGFIDDWWRKYTPHPAGK